MVPARRPQHSLGSSACAWAIISSRSWRGRRRRNGVDNFAGPSEDRTSLSSCHLRLSGEAPSATEFFYQERRSMARERVVLAYSGGLDTSVMVPWIGEKYNLDVVTF